ncbi:MAG: hypothetical protein RIC29_15965 [Rhodospirillaceae bacterium]
MAEKVRNAVFVQADYSGIQQIGLPPIGPVTKKPAVAPARQAERQQDDQRQQQNSQASQRETKSLFKTLLSESTLAGLNQANSKPFKSAETLSGTPAAVSAEQFVRLEKTPDHQSASVIANSDANFAYLATSRRNAEAAQNKTETARVTPLPQDFVTATSRYAELAVAASNVLASRGETLELQA